MLNSTHLSPDQYWYLGEGSYGTIYALETPHVFKLHKLNDERTAENCAAWEHEFAMQQKAYECNAALESLSVCIAKPYTFHYVQQVHTGLRLMPEAKEATACIFTMDRIVGGTKWNPYLRSPLPAISAPRYIFMGSLESKSNLITPDMLKDTTVHTLPNEAHSFCTTGLFGTYIQDSMVQAFFTLLDHGLMPRDIEYLLDGRTHTQTLMAIVDFNEVMTVQERATAYGEGYTVDLDAAHVYIDLCGLRSGNSVNPMASYDSPTPQWKFLPNPLVSPAAFLTSLQRRRQIGEIILEYAYTKRLLPILTNKLVQMAWKPLYVYKVLNASEIPSEDWSLGEFTEKEFREYRLNQCLFYEPTGSTDSETAPQTDNQEREIYVGTLDPAKKLQLDRFAEFDIQFQYYVLESLAKTATQRGQPFSIQPSETLWDCLKRVGPPTIPVDDWDVFALW